MPIVGGDAVSCWNELRAGHYRGAGREEATTSTSESDLSPVQLRLRRMVLDSVTSAHSRRNYAKALDLLFGLAAGRPLTRALLMEYRTSMEGLAP